MPKQSHKLHYMPGPWHLQDRPDSQFYWLWSRWGKSNFQLVLSMSKQTRRNKSCPTVTPISKTIHLSNAKIVTASPQTYEWMIEMRDVIRQMMLSESWMYLQPHTRKRLNELYQEANEIYEQINEGFKT